MDRKVWINGVESDGRIDVTDSSVLRGDGCFEVMRAYGGRVFALGEHLDRLHASAAMLEIDLSPRTALASWVESAAREEPDGAIRIVVTRGSALPGAAEEPKVVVFAHPWKLSPGPIGLLPVPAPWHSAGESWELSGAKILSYGPNMAATRKARRAGFDDAVLMTSEGSVLEGPTFSVAWVCDGVLETPGLALGILESITRRHVLGIATSLGVEVVEGVWDRGRLDDAVEVLAMSTIRQVQPVDRVGSLVFAPGPVTGRLAQSFAQLVGAAS